MCPFRMERIESATRVVLAFIEAFNHQDVAGMMRLVSEDSVLEAPSPAPDGKLVTGKAALTQYWSEFFHEHPRAHLKVEESIGCGMRCILRWLCSWVNEAADKRHIRGTTIYLVQNGLITCEFSYNKGSQN